MEWLPDWMCWEFIDFRIVVAWPWLPSRGRAAESIRSSHRRRTVPAYRLRRVGTGRTDEPDQIIGSNGPASIIEFPGLETRSQTTVAIHHFQQAKQLILLGRKLPRVRANGRQLYLQCITDIRHKTSRRFQMFQTPKCQGKTKL